MASPEALSVEHQEQKAQEPNVPKTHVERSEKFSGQVQSITLPSSEQTLRTKIQQLLQAELGPWDLVVSVGSDGLLITFDKDDPTGATEASEHIVQKINSALDTSCESQLIDIREKEGALHQTILAEHGTTEPGAAWVPLENTPEQKPEEDVATDAEEEETPRPIEYETAYAPMWNIRNEVLMGFAVMPINRISGGSDIYGRDVLGASATDADLHALDAAMLQKQINVAEELLPMNFTSLLVSQIHFDTLSSSTSRKEILEIAQQIPPYMKGIMMAAIVDIPESTPASTLAQRISGLPNHFRAMTITIPNSEFPIAACASMGATSVSYRIPKGPITEAVLTEAKKIISEATSARLLTVFEEVSDIRLAIALKKLGAVFIIGDCLGDMQDAPQNMKKLTVAEVQNGPLAAV